MPTRRALIIGSAFEDDNIRTGVLRDLSNWNAFLRSSIGGAWRKSEVTVLDTVDKDEVAHAMKGLCFVDYSMLYFSGHGYLKTFDRTTGAATTNVLIGEEPVEESLIYPEASKSLVILDCCRGIDKQLTVISESLAEEVAEAATKVASVQEGFVARQYFDSAIELMDDARVVIYSVSPKVLASGPGDVGGIFTYFFLEGALHFDTRSSRVNRGSLDRRSPNIVYANEAFRWAAPEVDKWRIQQKAVPQNPVYSADRLIFHPPIAVRF